MIYSLSKRRGIQVTTLISRNKTARLTIAGGCVVHLQASVEGTRVICTYRALSELLLQGLGFWALGHGLNQRWIFGR